MNPLNTLRPRSAMAVLAVAATALLAPSSAMASHNIGYYKVEKHITMYSDERTAELSCDMAGLPGGNAVDGMWRIDHVDQDDDENVFPGPWVSTGDYGEAVQVISAYNEAFNKDWARVGDSNWDTPNNKPKDNDPSKYFFRFVKNAVGMTQLKIWITCVPDKTEYNKPSAPHHYHALDLATTVPAATSPGTVTTADSTNLPTLTADSTSVTCDASKAKQETVVAPSFNWWSGSGRIVKSTLTAAAATPATAGALPPLNAWSWQFTAATPSADVRVGWLCLKGKVGAVGAAAGESDGSTSTHRLIRKLATGVSTASDPTNTETIVPGAEKTPYTESRTNCSAHYKGLLGGFDATSSDSLYFMGMDPRIKSRAFRFMNTDVGIGGASHDVDVLLICLNDRTS